MTWKERLLLLTLTAVNFTHIMDFMIMMPLGPQLMSLFGISPQQFGFAVSAYSVTAGCTSFGAAFFADRFDRRQMLLWAYVGFVAGTFSCAFAPSYALLVAARVLAGFFGGMIGAQVLSIVSDTFEYERRGRAMGNLMTAFSLASVIGVPSGLWLAARFSWHAPFLVIGGLGLAIVALIVAYIPPMTKHLQAQDVRSSPFDVLRNVFRVAHQRWALLFSSVLMLGHFCIIPYFAPSLVGNVGYSPDHIFLIYLVGGTLTIFSAPVVGRLADRRGKYPVFVTFALLSLIPVWLITHLWPQPMWVVLTVAGLFFVFVNGRMIPMQAMVSNVVPPQQRGGFMSINSSV
ncbi:MAG TPA: MFS transporter, partial [Saprospiraceae bacterium]|nr:MFS transporter [Saprospiraceae bacterium]